MINKICALAIAVLFCFMNIRAGFIGEAAVEAIIKRAREIFENGDGPHIDRGELAYFEEIARNAGMDPHRIRTIINLKSIGLLSLLESVTLQKLVIQSMPGIVTVSLPEDAFFRNVDALDSDIMYYATTELRGRSLDLKEHQYLANACCILCTELTKAKIYEYIETLGKRLNTVDHAISLDQQNSTENILKSLRYEIALTILHLDGRIKNLKPGQKRISVNILPQVSQMVEPTESQWLESCTIL